MKDKFMIFAGIGFGIVIVALVVVLILTITTDVFKPTSELFQQFLVKNIEQINTITDVSKDNDYLNILKQSNYRDNTSVKINYKNSQGKTENFNLISTGITNNPNNSYRKVNLKYGENFDVMNAEFLQENQTYGILFSDIVTQFVSADITDYKEFLNKVGIDITEIEKYKIPKIWNILLNKKENIETICSDVIKETGANQYSIQKNKEITLDNGESQITTAYILTLTNEQTNRLVLNVLRELEETDIINQITNSKKDFSQTRITINVLNKKVSRMVIEAENQELIIEFYENQLILKGNNVSIGDIDIKKINIKKSSEKTYINFESNTDNITLAFGNSIDGVNANTNIQFNLKNSYIQELDIDLQQKIETSNSNLEIPKKFTNENNVNISKLNVNTFSTALNSLLARIDTKIVEINNQIYSEALNKILEQNKNLENKYLSDKENEKQQFNNLFMGYKGDNVDKNTLLNLLDLVSRNISKYEVRGDQAVRIFIEQGQTNIEMTNEIKKFIEKSEKNFKVDFQYNSEGKLNIIIIEKIEDER